MTTSPKAVRFDEDTMWVDLADGRTLGVPLGCFPRLLKATPADRQRVRLSRLGRHWEDLDEDISVAGLLAGARRHDNAIRTSGFECRRAAGLFSCNFCAILHP
jgi:hypothetical protein